MNEPHDGTRTIHEDIDVPPVARIGFHLRADQLAQAHATPAQVDLPVVDEEAQILCQPKHNAPRILVRKLIRESTSIPVRSNFNPFSNSM